MQCTGAHGMAPGTPRYPLLNAITTAFATWAHAEVDDGAYLLGEGRAGTLIQVKAMEAHTPIARWKMARGRWSSHGQRGSQHEHAEPWLSVRPARSASPGTSCHMVC